MDLCCMPDEAGYAAMPKMIAAYLYTKQTCVSPGLLKALASSEGCSGKPHLAGVSTDGILEPKPPILGDLSG